MESSDWAPSESQLFQTGTTGWEVCLVGGDINEEEKQAADPDPPPLSEDAQTLLKIKSSLETKKKQLSALIGDIAKAQKDVDTGYSEFEDVAAKARALTSKFSVNECVINLDELRSKIQQHLKSQKDLLEQLQPERDALVKEIESMTEMFTSYSHTCSVCYEKPANAALTKCGHVYCEQCIREVRNQCPKCRAYSQVFLKLYF